MPNYQLLLGLSKHFDQLTLEEKAFIDYFTKVNIGCIDSVISTFHDLGPKGFGNSLILCRMVKVKERISSDRELAIKLRKNEIYRFVCQLSDGCCPAHNSFNTLRIRLGSEGFRTIHKNFVLQAHGLDLLNPKIKALPQHRKKGIILIADSTFIPATCSTKGTKDDQGHWVFKDPSVAFGRPHHKYKYPVGHKCHSLITINGIPLVSIISAANEYDQEHIFSLLEMLFHQFPELEFAYIILDRGYDDEKIHAEIYEHFGIIPIIIRKKMVYPKGYSRDGFPLCPFGKPTRRKGIEYKNRRTKYACYKSCLKSSEQILFNCNYQDVKYRFGYTSYTYFEDNYRKFGPALPTMRIYKTLKPFRTGIERTYGLVKENRYRMISTNRYKGIDNVLIHVLEHDIILTQDIIYDYSTMGKMSPIIKLNY